MSLCRELVLHVLAIFFIVVEISGALVQAGSWMDFEDQLSRLKELDLPVITQDVVKSLLAELSAQLILNEHLKSHITLVVLASGPDHGLEVVSLDLDEYAHRRHCHWKYLANEADATIKSGMAQDFAKHVLCYVLEFKRILFVKSQHYAPIDHDVNMFVVVEYDLAEAFLDNLEVWKHLDEFLHAHFILLEPVEQRLLPEEEDGLLLVTIALLPFLCFEMRDLLKLVVSVAVKVGVFVLDAHCFQKQLQVVLDFLSVDLDWQHQICEHALGLPESLP